MRVSESTIFRVELVMYGLVVGVVALVVVAIVCVVHVATYPAAYLSSLQEAAPAGASNKLIMIDESIGLYIAGDIDVSAPVILFSHGNGVSLGYWDDGGEVHKSPMVRLADSLHHWTGVPVIIYDYPGFGSSTGTPCQASVNRTAERVFEFATNTLQIPKSNVTLIGHSLGTGPTLKLAVKHPEVKDVILWAPFCSIFSVVLPKAIVRCISFLDSFDNVALVKRLERDVRVVHGTRDTIIPYSHSETICAASTRCNLTLIDNDHVDLMMFAKEFVKKYV